VSFVTEEEIPRTATGKIQHGLLRKRFANTNAAAAAG
jgi:acyl-coenzyme A synthetase/AMP-(fatty) acid ligase